MELLQRLLGETNADCGCGHSAAVHWRREEGPKLWCSAPGCTCSREVVGEDAQEVHIEEGDGVRIIPPGARGARGRRTA
jgi:hypothetical protein